MKKFNCLVVLSFFCGIVFADNPLRLFHIEMNKNPNIVCYDAMLDSNNQINKENPVDSYWVSFTEKNKKREKLNTSDKKIYGFKTKFIVNSDLLTLFYNYFFFYRFVTVYG